MDAVILAAGVGSRLKGFTSDKPKCMVRVNGKCIVDYQLDALLGGGVDTVYVVAGYMSGVLKAHLGERYPGERRLQVVENAVFATTNNMYSLYRCAGHLRGKPFLLMNGDVVLEDAVIDRLLGAPGSAVCVDVGSFAEESMKVVVRPGEQYISGISKTIPQAEAFGCSIDVYRFAAEASSVLFDHLDQTVRVRGRVNDWTEVALNDLMRDGRLLMVPQDIEGAKWYEIDSQEDLTRAELLFGQDQLDWTRVKMAFVDLDGTLYKGSEAVPGADQFVAELRRRVPHVVFLSNNSSNSHEDYQAKLARFGIAAAAEDVLISSDALGVFLRLRNVTRAYVLGTKSLHTVLRDKYGVTHDARDPQALVLGFDRELTYEKLEQAALLLQRASVPYYATHLDVVCPTERGNIPDAGSMIALLEKATGRTPEKAFGKPDSDMVRFLFAKHQVLPEESVFIGDRVYTDYVMARNCGARFLGVLTGESTRREYEPCENIVVFPSVADIFAKPSGGIEHERK
jgi:HAD superfamily hydrolase (TIGR01450 family)